MRILFLSHYFPPEVNAPASRTYEHCRHWVAEGHKVTVVTCQPNHPRGEVYAGYRNKLFQRETVDGIEVIRLWTWISANEGFIKRTLGYISYMLMSIFCCFNYGRHDVLISTSPQFFNGWAGYFVSRIKGIPWVLEIRDLWPESIIAVGAIKNKKIIAILERIENFCYRKAEHIVVVTQAFKAHILARGIDSHKIDVVYNGVDPSFFDPEKHNAKEGMSPDDGLPAALGEQLQGKFVAAYIGTHGMAHGLNALLDAALLLKHEENIHILMVGDGAERSKLMTRCEMLGLTNLTLCGQVPRASMPAIWALSHVSLVLLKKSDLFKTVIPSKIFEAMAMRKPIILGVEGEVKTIVEKSGSGICIEPESAEQIAAAITALYRSKDNCAAMGERGGDYVLKNFDRNVLAQSFLNILLATKDKSLRDKSAANAKLKMPPRDVS
ncbi:MAG: glycosyltransferase family 4 protein [Gammaproteobacteria bacterium]|nr:glycosyltransferase family 4 protein [Gammaproteobacteria bacterium]MBQ0840673.1 glycosyltransferase family 4 protein [Gammaproteobacteria bacterium]